MIDLVRRGHLLGGGMLSTDEKYFYLSIPKNASTFLTNVLKDNKWTFWNVSRGNYDTVIIILRDPIERWISGFSTYVSLWIISPEYNLFKFIKNYNELVERFIFDNLIFDDHTAPQSFFVNNLPNANKVYVKANQLTLIQSVSSITNQELFVSPSTFDNTKESNMLTKELNNFILSKLTPTLTNKIKEIYKNDYDLINRVQFYDPR